MQVGIVDDIRSEEEAIEFALKLKTLASHKHGAVPQYFYLMPNYSETEMALLGCSPHIIHDGTSIM